ncbi:MAG: hypothetical protein ACI9LT_002739, partial [Pseudoalteromonas distincta]
FAINQPRLGSAAPAPAIADSGRES